MPLSGNIFKTGAKAKSENPDFAGRFRSGMQVNDRPMSLEAWRVTTGDPDVADRLAEILEAIEPPSEWETKSGESLQVFGTKDEVEVIFSPGGVKASLVLWSKKGGKVRETDGEFLIEDGKVTSKPDPDADLPLEERKQMAKDGIGPEPSLQAYFRLKDAPELGKFKFFSGAWTAIENFADAEALLAHYGKDCYGTFRLEQVSYTDKKTNKPVSFTKPVIIIHGPVQ